MNTKIQTLLQKEIQKKHSHSIMLAVQSKDKQVNFADAVGFADTDKTQAITAETPYFIASITKMYTAAIIMKLYEQNLLDLDAPIMQYLPEALIEGIHVYKDVDYSKQLKVYQLVHQSSGLADYFEGKPKTGSSLIDNLKNGDDYEFDVKEAVRLSHNVSPEFAPDAKNGKKSHYSDTNYQLLGAIIEKITQKPLADTYQTMIFEPLGLTETYLYDYQMIREGQQPVLFYNKDQVLNIPKTMTSFAPDGSIVSTLVESLIFLRAFFNGKLFNGTYFKRMMRWNNLFFPMQYGYGMMRFQLPRLMTLFRYSPELIGHSGASASFAFYAPREELYLVGSFNQIDSPSRPFMFMLKVMNALK